MLRCSRATTRLPLVLLVHCSQQWYGAELRSMRMPCHAMPCHSLKRPHCDTEHDACCAFVRLPQPEGVQLSNTSAATGSSFVELVELLWSCLELLRAGQATSEQARTYMSTSDYCSCCSSTCNCTSPAVSCAMPTLCCTCTALCTASHRLPACSCAAWCARWLRC